LSPHACPRQSTPSRALRRPAERAPRLAGTVAALLLVLGASHAHAQSLSFPNAPTTVQVLDNMNALPAKVIVNYTFPISPGGAARTLTLEIESPDDALVISVGTDPGFAFNSFLCGPATAINPWKNTCRATTTITGSANTETVEARIAFRDGAFAFGDSATLTVRLKDGANVIATGTHTMSLEATPFIHMDDALTTTSNRLGTLGGVPGRFVTRSLGVREGASSSSGWSTFNGSSLPSLPPFPATNLPGGQTTSYAKGGRAEAIVMHVDLNPGVTYLGETLPPGWAAGTPTLPSEDKRFEYNSSRGIGANALTTGSPALSFLAPLSNNTDAGSITLRYFVPCSVEGTADSPLDRSWVSATAPRTAALGGDFEVRSPNYGPSLASLSTACNGDFVKSVGLASGAAGNFGIGSAIAYRLELTPAINPVPILSEGLFVDRIPPGIIPTSATLSSPTLPSIPTHHIWWCVAPSYLTPFGRTVFDALPKNPGAPSGDYCTDGPIPVATTHLAVTVPTWPIQTGLLADGTTPFEIREPVTVKLFATVGPLSGLVAATAAGDCTIDAVASSYICINRACGSWLDSGVDAGTELPTASIESPDFCHNIATTIVTPLVTTMITVHNASMSPQQIFAPGEEARFVVSFSNRTPQPVQISGAVAEVLLPAGFVYDGIIDSNGVTITSLQNCSPSVGAPFTFSVGTTSVAGSPAPQTQLTLTLTGGPHSVAACGSNNTTHHLQAVGAAFIIKAHAASGVPYLANTDYPVTAAAITDATDLGDSDVVRVDVPPGLGFSLDALPCADGIVGLSAGTRNNGGTALAGANLTVAIPPGATFVSASTPTFSAGGASVPGSGTLVIEYATSLAGPWSATPTSPVGAVRLVASNLDPYLTASFEVRVTPGGYTAPITFAATTFAIGLQPTNTNFDVRTDNCPGTVTVIKTFGVNGPPMQDVSFSLGTSSATTNAAGTLVFGGVAAATYTLTETLPTSGNWTSSIGTGLSVIVGPNQAVTVTVVNTCTCGPCGGTCAINGVCTGNDCNDDDLCTTDACIDDACVHTAIVCPVAGQCATSSCDAELGCQYQNVTLGTACENDGDLCTFETCQADAFTNNPAFLCLQSGETNECDRDLGICSIETCDPNNGECRAGEFGANNLCGDLGGTVFAIAVTAPNGDENFVLCAIVPAGYDGNTTGAPKWICVDNDENGVPDTLTAAETSTVFGTGLCVGANVPDPK